MNHTASARAEAPRAPSLVLIGLAVVITAIVATLVRQSASSSVPPFSEVRRADLGDTATEVDAAGTEDDGAITEADGVLPDGVAVFDGEYPGVANLDAALLQALREAATDAADDGIEIQINSGWRSSEYQEQLLREAVSTYGSEEAAARWVASANTSAHVSGDAVDIGPFDAMAWLSEHGANYGLCQTYRNESWHYELRPEATSSGCPQMYAGPGHDPGMPP